MPKAALPPPDPDGVVRIRSHPAVEAQLRAELRRDGWCTAEEIRGGRYRARRRYRRLARLYRIPI
jgi:hypothetical protein